MQGIDRIIFFNCTWSKANLYLKHLQGILNKYPNIKLEVFDIDDDKTKEILEKYNLVSHGKGEMLIFKNKQLLKRVIDYEKESKSVLDLLT